MRYDVIETITRSDSGQAFTRLWQGGQLVSTLEGRSDLIAPCLIDTSWPDGETERGYWQRGSVPIGDSVIQLDGRRISFEPAGWISLSCPDRPLPGATFSFSIAVAGLALDPTASLFFPFRVDDGQPSFANPGSSDITVIGHAVDIVPWVVGGALFRDIAASVVVDGDLMLLGGLAGVLALSGGFRFSDDVVSAARTMTALVGAHRGMASQMRAEGDVWEGFDW